MKNFGWLMAYALTSFFGVIWSGYVFSIMWAWFIVSIFNAPVLSINSAIGLSLVVSYLTYRVDNKEDKRTVVEKFGSMVVNAAMKPLVFLAFGYIVRLFA